MKHLNLILLLITSCIVFGQKIPKERYYSFENHKGLIYPHPKEYKESKELWKLSKNAVIVLGDSYGTTEKYAAKRFQFLTEKVAKRKLPIITESEISEKHSQIFLLGKRTSNKEIDRLCKKFNIQLNNTMPNGFENQFSDGFVIETLEENKRQIILIGGSNNRGVVYGQDACYDLLTPIKKGVYFPKVKVRDWPTVKIRQCLAFSDYYNHVGYNSIIRSRYNQVNIGSGGADHGISFRQTYNKFKQMGISVWAGVGGAIPEKAQASQLKALRTALEKGAEGIYISFDDAGMGENPIKYIKEILAIAKEFNIPIGNISTTTLPYNDYPSTNQSIQNLISHFPEFKKASFTITKPPTKKVYEDYKKVGVEWKYWYNWPMGAKFNPVVETGKNYLTAYRPIPEITQGWGSPTYKQFRIMEKYTPHTLFSLATTRDKCDITGYLFGLASWHPGGFNKADAHKRIHSYVFALDVIDEVAKMNEILLDISNYFETEFGIGRIKSNFYRSPTHLKDISKREEVLAKITNAKNYFKKIKASSLLHSSLEIERLQEYYLRPIAFSINGYERVTKEDFPEYHINLDSIQSQVWRILEKDGDTKAQTFLNKKFASIDSYVNKVIRNNSDMAQMYAYAEKWDQKRTLTYWKNLISSAQKKYTLRINRDKTGNIHIKRKDKKSTYDIYYSVDGETPGHQKDCFRYANPYKQQKENIVLKATIYDSDKDKHGYIIERPLGILKSKWKLLKAPKLEHPEHLFDDNWNTYAMSDPSVDYWATGDKIKRPKQEAPYEFIIDLGQEESFSSIGIMPGVSFDPHPINPDFGSATLRGSPEKVIVYISEDGKNWNSKIEKPFSYKLERWFQEDLAHKLYQKIPLQGKARYIKIIVPSVIANVNCITLSEIDIFR